MAHPFDGFVAAQMREHQIPGLSLAVVGGGEILEARGYGTARAGRDGAVAAGTLFQACSISKCLAAVAALRLVSEERLALDAPVESYLRSWRIQPAELTEGHPVTLRQILSHNAGFSVHGFRGYAPGQPVPALLQILEGEPPANNSAIRVTSRPGTAPRYSGGGYTVLQQLLMDVTGRAFDGLMEALVLRPLGMSASSFAQPLPEGLGALAATGHHPDGTPVPGGAHVYPELAAAGLWTTAPDLARFILGVRQALWGRAGALLSPPVAAEMLTANSAGYGLGFLVPGSGKSRQFLHSGRNAGFDAVLAGTVETGKGVVILANANVGPKVMNGILKAVVRGVG